MYQLYPTITTSELRDNPSVVYKAADKSPIVVMSRATPKIVCISPTEWNKIAQLLEDQEDIIASLKVELAIALGEESLEEITDFTAFRAEMMDEQASEKKIKDVSQEPNVVVDFQVAGVPDLVPA